MAKVTAAVKKAAVNATGKTVYAAKKAGGQVGQAFKMTGQTAAVSAKNIPAAAKNSVMRPVASAKGAGKAIKNIAASATVRVPGMVRRGEGGAAAVAGALVATGLAIPVGAINGAAKANKKGQQVGPPPGRAGGRQSDFEKVASK